MQKGLLQKAALLIYQPKTSFTILSKGRVVVIPFSQITHISKYGQEIFVHTTQERFTTCLSMTELEHALPVNDFFRVHKSHIIALRSMNGVNGNNIIVARTKIPISDYYKRRLLESLKKILNNLCMLRELNLPAPS